MKSARTTLSAIALLAALIGLTTAPTFASVVHPICASNQHDCGKTPKVTTCCCWDEQASQTESTPVQSRIDVRADLSSMPAVWSAVHVATTPHVLIAVHTSPPHRDPLDLTTLFSTLLI